MRINRHVWAVLLTVTFIMLAGLACDSDMDNLLDGDEDGDTDSADGDSPDPYECKRGESTCLGNDAYDCGLDNKWRFVQSCKALGDYVCRYGICVRDNSTLPDSCTSGEYACKDDDIYQCMQDGSWDFYYRCTNEGNYYCEDGLCYPFDQPDGDQPDGDQPDGDQPDGDQPDGDQPDGDQPDGDQPDGDQTDGDQPDGDQPDGDQPDGDQPDGDQPDGDLPDGDSDVEWFSIPDIQNPSASNHPEPGTRVRLNDIIVTSIPFQVSTSGLQGIFVSEQGGGDWAATMLIWKPTSVDSTYGYDPPSMSPGHLIDVEGVYAEFCGIDEANPYTYCSTQIELTPYQMDKGRVVNTGRTATVPEPIPALPCYVATGGSYAEKYQHALVRTTMVEVTDVSLGYGEFELNDCLRVDDLLYSYAMPSVGESYIVFTGFLYTSYDDFKLLPRDPSDM